MVSQETAAYKGALRILAKSIVFRIFPHPAKISLIFIQSKIDSINWSPNSIVFLEFLDEFSIVLMYTN